MRKIGFGVIGCGNVANNFYMPYIAKVANLVAVCDVILERAKRSASLWGAKEYYDDPEKVLKHPDVEVVVILTSHESHAPLAIRAAEEGKNFILQKPMGISLKEAEEIARAVRKNKVKALIEPSDPFFSPLVRKIEELIKEGKIGRVCFFTSSTAHSGPTWGEWFYRWERGGGPIYDLGVYDVARAIKLFGEPKELHVAASLVVKERLIIRPEEHTSTIAPEYYKKYPGSMYYQGIKPSLRIKPTAPDNVVMVLRFKDDILGVIRANFVTFAGMEFGMKVYGTEAIVEVPNFYRCLMKIRRSDGQEEVLEEKDIGELRLYYYDSVDHTIECIVEDKEPLPSVEWGLKIMKVLAKAHELSVKGGGYEKFSE
ncbi:MAG: hypothetical protein DRN15_07850 [Thermoprotei archaeon]|nr:MAG: hypothetical protein DRN15_07850 [Thermoprotei archaeon]